MTTAVRNKQAKLYRWNVVVELLPEHGALRGAEVGVWRGECSSHLLGMVPSLTLFMVDRWSPDTPGGRYHDSGDSKAVTTQRDHDDAMASAQRVAKAHGPRGIILVGESADMARRVENDSLDFAFIDGDHTREGVIEDIAAWIPKVKPGGVIVGHDFSKYGVAEGVRTMIGGAFHLSHDDTWWHRVRKGLR